MKGGRLAPEAADFLRKSAAFLDLQMEDLQEEREIYQRQAKLSYLSGRLQFLLQLLGLAGGVAIALAVVVIAWSAVNDHALVVEAYSVPPDMAQQGMSGRLTAQLMLDRLNDMQEKARSARALTSFVNSWSGDSHVEIPETGISIGELDSLLRRWLGHQTHISGEVYRSGGALVVTARVDDKSAHVFAGTPAEFEVLLQRSAEAIYADTQPFRYIAFLNRSGRHAEALAAARHLAEDRAASALDRAWSHALWGSLVYMDGEIAAAARIERDATQGAPTLPLARHYLALAELGLGHDEQALEAARTGQRLYARPSADINKPGAEYLGKRLHQVEAELTGDYLGAAAASKTFEGGSDQFGGALVTPCKTIQNGALAHDGAAARQALAEWGQANDASLLPIAAKAGMVCLPLWSMARTDGAWAQGLTDLISADHAAVAAGPAYATLRLTGLTPWLAFARLKTGDGAGARALIETTPLDCYLCLRMRGQIAEAAGDRPAADRWFSEAIRRAPSAPFAYSEWGQIRVARGDVAGGLALYAKATGAGPHFAEPLELWAEALLASGDLKAAEAKFAAAQLHAPRWGRLHLKWGETLAKLGDTKAAGEKWRAASGMDLSATERAQLQALLAGRST